MRLIDQKRTIGQHKLVLLRLKGFWRYPDRSKSGARGPGEITVTLSCLTTTKYAEWRACKRPAAAKAVLKMLQQNPRHNATNMSTSDKLSS